MASSITIRRPEGPVRATLALPRSKSISNRALICAALAGDLSCVHEWSDADDTRILHKLLLHRPATMDCGDGGTTFRFLLAWAVIREGEEHVITGSPRLLSRPHGDLIRALRSLGADIEERDGSFRIRGRALTGGTVNFDSPMSSQFISALMLIAPRMEKGLTIQWTGRRLSEPYVEMTARVLRHFNVEVRSEGQAIHIPPAAMRASTLRVPSDWSAAAFWYEVVALCDGSEILLEGLMKDGWQGDEVVADHLACFVETIPSDRGLLLRYRQRPGPIPDVIDLKNAPDLFPYMAVTFAARGASISIEGLDNLSLKESDRIAAVANLLSRAGVRVSMESDALRLEGGTVGQVALEVDPDHDHRIALAAAPLTLVTGQVTILDHGVVTKSYPSAWDELRRSGFPVEGSV